jgi:D-lactate dehydrogenase
MTKIAFLDVAPDEKAFVTAQFSDAIIAEADAAPASLAEMEVLVVFVTTPVTDEYLKALPKLRLLCTRSAGTDHIDLKACAARGITVCSVPDYGSHVIAEHAFALLLSAVRHVSEGHARVKTGDFSWRGLKGLALKGKTIGVVGTGRIGRCAMQIAQGFGMNVLAYDVFHAPGIEYSTWEDVWQKSDVVSLHLPLIVARWASDEVPRLRSLPDV